MQLERWLIDNGVGKRAFARRLGVDPETVRIWCRGRGRPANPQYDAILAATGGQVTPNDFLPPSDAPAPNTPRSSREGQDAA